MSRYTRFARARLMSAALMIIASLALPATGFASANDLYRIEVIVFRNLNVPAEPDQVPEIRRFFDAFDLETNAASPAPVALEKADGSFANIWTRLERLADYEPLMRLTFEQSMYDYHPKVRVHNEVIMGRELHFPAEIVYLDLTAGSAGNPRDRSIDLFADYLQPLYQLDGTIRMRRSRFLHIDLDLEYRLPGPAWSREFPAQPDDLLEPGFEWLGTAPEPGPATAAQPLLFIEEPIGVDPAAEPLIAEPFELYRLVQSRQVRSNTLQYFDSAYLGAIVRVTPIAAATP